MIAPRYCSYAFEGTFGHECGDPAAVVAVFSSELTEDGLYYSGRCDSCLKNGGRDNASMLRTEPESGQVNRWQGRS